MAKSIEQQIAILEKKIPELEARLEKVKKWAFSSGDVSPDEEAAIEKIEKQIADLKKKKVELNEKLGVIDFSGAGEQIKSEIRRYDDQFFLSAFKQSINNWCQDKAIKLNSIRTYMIERKEPAGLEVKDIVSVVELVWPPAKYIKTAIDLAEIAEKAMNSYLNAVGGNTPSLNDIHSAWADALDTLNANSAQSFPGFVAYFKRENAVPSDVDKTVVELFLPACASFADKNMPSGKDVEKAFVKKILSTVQDSWDWDDGAGFADMTMITPSSSAEHFGSPEGQLDDVPSDLLQAIKTVYKNDRVIDLPIPIKVTVKTHMGAYETVIERKSKTPGDTSFKMTDGEDHMYQGFMKGKFYNSLLVSHLKIDS